MTNIQLASTQLQRKLAAGQIEVTDLETAREVAKATSNIRDLVLYTKVKWAIEQAEVAETIE